MYKRQGLFTGFVNSLLQMLLGFYAPPAPGLLPLVGMILLDYVLAFTPVSYTHLSKSPLTKQREKGVQDYERSLFRHDDVHVHDA